MWSSSSCLVRQFSLAAPCSTIATTTTEFAYHRHIRAHRAKARFALQAERFSLQSIYRLIHHHGSHPTTAAMHWARQHGTNFWHPSSSRTPLPESFPNYNTDRPVTTQSPDHNYNPIPPWATNNNQRTYAGSPSQVAPPWRSNESPQPPTYTTSWPAHHMHQPQPKICMQCGAHATLDKHRWCDYCGAQYPISRSTSPIRSHEVHPHTRIQHPPQPMRYANQKQASSFDAIMHSQVRTSTRVDLGSSPAWFTDLWINPNSQFLKSIDFNNPPSWLLDLHDNAKDTPSPLCRAFA